MQKPKIVYILGSGRSGSTILDMLLGNHEDIESFGELANIATAGWINNEYCSSGVRVNDSPFWNGVKSKFLEKVKNENAIPKFAVLTNTINKKKIF